MSASELQIFQTVASLRSIDLMLAKREIGANLSETVRDVLRIEARCTALELFSDTAADALGRAQVIIQRAAQLQR